MGNLNFSPNPFPGLYTGESKHIASHLKLIEAGWRMYASVNEPSLVQIVACNLVGTKPLSEPMLQPVNLNPSKHYFMKL